MADLADYQWLTSPQAVHWLEDHTSTDDPLHQKLGRLRKELPAERARLVVQQIELRGRAIPKFGKLATNLFFTDVALQQATDLWTARYKASRIPQSEHIVDYCCGIGGDLLAFAEQRATTGWDRAPEIAQLATANLRAIKAASTSDVRVGNVEAQLPAPEEVWHLDPDRRTDGRRSTQLQWHSPGPELVDRWLQTSSRGVLKLAPATLVPASWSEQAELEWITFDRQCRQQIVWFGELAQASGLRRATTLLKPTHEDDPPKPASFVGMPSVAAPLSTGVAKYLYDTDPAIRAAGLTGALAVEHNLLSLESGASYLTSDQAVEDPLLARFEVLDQLPLRVATLRKYLQTRNIGHLEIKKRGVDTDPERLRKQLKLGGDAAATLLLTRLANREIAILARRDQG